MVSSLVSEQPVAARGQGASGQMTWLKNGGKGKEREEEGMEVGREGMTCLTALVTWT